MGTLATHSGKNQLRRSKLARLGNSGGSSAWGSLFKTTFSKPAILCKRMANGKGTNEGWCNQRWEDAYGMRPDQKKCGGNLVDFPWKIIHNYTFKMLSHISVAKKTGCFKRGRNNMYAVKWIRVLTGKLRLLAVKEKMTSDLVFLALWTQHHELKKHSKVEAERKSICVGRFLVTCGNRIPPGYWAFSTSLVTKRLLVTCPPGVSCWVQNGLKHSSETSPPHIYMYTCVDICVYLYICIYAYMHICINMHITHTHTYVYNYID